MKFRNTLILLAILVILVGYVVLVERKHPPPDDASATELATTLPPILSYQATEARALRLIRPSTGERTELALRDDALWYLIQPTEEEADQSKVISLVASLGSLRPQRVLTGTVGRPAEYDLDPPALQVEVELADGTVYRVNLGAQNAARSGYYAQVPGDEHIYLLPFHIGADVERYLNQLPVKPTPLPTLEGTMPPRIPPPPTATPGGWRGSWVL